MYYAYILHSNSNSKNKYYVGRTQDITYRITRHNTGRSKYIKYGIPWYLVKVSKLIKKHSKINWESNPPVVTLNVLTYPESPYDTKPPTSPPSVLP